MPDHKESFMSTDKPSQEDKARNKREMTCLGSSVGTGALIGTAVAGPIGTVIGGLVGLAAAPAAILFSKPKDGSEKNTG